MWELWHTLLSLLMVLTIICGSTFYFLLGSTLGALLVIRADKLEK